VAKVSVQGGGQFGETTEAGEYTLSGLRTGRYRITYSTGNAEAGDYEDAYQPNNPNAVEPEWIEATQGADTEHVEAELNTGATIRGTLTAPGGARGAGVTVDVISADSGYSVASATTSPSGEYEVRSLAPGSYVVQFVPRSASGLLPEYYGGGSSFAAATRVNLLAEGVATSVNGTLTSGAEVKGIVTRTVGGTRVEGVGVELIDEAEPSYPSRVVYTNYLGEYESGALQPGAYKIRFRAGAVLNLLTEYDGGALQEAVAAAMTLSVGRSVTEDIALGEAGQIIRRVISATTKSPLQHVRVYATESPYDEVYEGEYGAVASTTTNAAGGYTLRGLAGGDVYVQFSPTEEDSAYGKQYYDGHESPEAATPVAVTPGQVAQHIDAELGFGGEITGEVTAGGTPVAGVAVAVISAATGQYAWFGVSGEGGKYTARGLSTGSYRVECDRSETADYITQYYPDKASLYEGETLSVKPGSAITGINAAMVLAGEITGQVTGGEPAAPVEGVEVCADPLTSGDYEQCAETEASGDYTIAGMQTGAYKVAFTAAVGDNLAPLYFSQQLSYGTAASVSVATGSVTTNVNAVMAVGAQITGKVNSAATPSGIAGIEVCGYPTTTSDPYPACVYTNDRGEYDLDQLDGGGYRVRFGPASGSPLDLVRRYYGDHADLAEASIVTTTAGEITSGINETLHEGGGISGEVTRILNGEPLEYIEVCPYLTSAYEQSGQCAETNAHGEYALTGVPAGTVNVYYEPEGRGNYEAVRYEVPVEPPKVTSGINESIRSITDPIVPTEITPPTIAGSPRQGSLLTEGHGTWTNDPLSYEYVWLECTSLGTSCSDIPDAYDEPTFAPRAMQVGQTIEVQERATNVEGTGPYATSAPTEVVVAAVPVNEGPPTISGVAQEGQELTASTGEWSNEPISYTYAWERCSPTGTNCKLIEGATAASYKADEEDREHELRVSVTAHNSGGASAAAVSNPSGVVAGLAPIELTAPSITGAPGVGQTLTVIAGSWTGSPTKVKYRWQKCNSAGQACEFIAGAKSANLLVASAELGYTIRVLETAVNTYGEGLAASSQPTHAILAGVPGLISAPAIGGTPAVGEVLFVTEFGTWSNEPTESKYEWQLCSSSGGSCVPLAGTLYAEEYAVTTEDVGHTLRFVETRSNVVGESAPGASLPSGIVATDAPTNVTAPRIEGYDAVGVKLQVRRGTWRPEPTSPTYQWERCGTTGGGCEAIGGQTRETYELGAADVGYRIRVLETVRNEYGSSQPASSTATEAVVASPPVNIHPPGVTGVPVQGDTLEATEGEWSGSPTRVTYEWERCEPSGEGCVDAAGGTNYAVSAADLGQVIRVVATASNAGGPGLPATSAPTEKVVAGVPEPLLPPVIHGIDDDGQTLTVEHAAWANEPTRYTYQWQRCSPAAEGCTEIEGATQSEYELTEADVGHTIEVEEGAENLAGPAIPVFSEPTGEILPQIPVNTLSPAITGIAGVGQTLHAEHGNWTSSPESYVYQWLQCGPAGVIADCAKISGANADGYLVEAGDAGHTIRVEVSAVNAAGTSAATIATQTAVVESVPTVVSPPSIVGTAQLDQTLVAEDGTWHPEPSGYTEQWFRCDEAGASCGPIAGATHQSYVPTVADLKHRLEVAVTAHNDAGAGPPATSSATLPVTRDPLQALASIRHQCERLVVFA
jgi:hypothetical protein